MIRRAGVVPALVLGLGLVLLVIVMTRSEPRLAGSANVAPGAFGTPLEPARRVCQGVAEVPNDTGALRLLIGTDGRLHALLTASVEEAGRRIAVSNATSVRTGAASLRLHPVLRQGARDARICIRNDGRSRVALAGVFVPATVSGGPRLHVLSLTFLRPGRASALSQVPEVLDRYPASRGGLSSAWLVLAAVLFVAGASLGIALVVREPGP